MSLRTGAIYSTCRYVDINTCTFFNTTITVSVLGSVQFWIKLVFLLLVSEEKWIETNLQLKHVLGIIFGVWSNSETCRIGVNFTKAVRTQWQFRKKINSSKFVCEYSVFNLYIWTSLWMENYKRWNLLIVTVFLWGGGA